MSEYGDDNLIKPNADNRYPYPFTSSLSWDYGSDREKIISKQLDLINKSPISENLLREPVGNFFKARGFDLQSTIDQVKGTALEIAGPTSDGFDVLKGITFPERPIITNIGSATRPGIGFESLTKLDKHAVDILADGTMLPLADRSIGVLLISCVNILDLEGLNIDNSMPNERLLSYYGEVYGSIIRKVEEGVKPKDILSDASCRHFTRPLILLEATRVLKPGGIIIFKGPRLSDVELALSLGFEIKEHSFLIPSSEERNGQHIHLPREMIFQLK